MKEFNLLINAVTAFIVFGSIVLWVVVMPPVVVLPTLVVLSGWLGWQVRRVYKMQRTDNKNIKE